MKVKYLALFSTITLLSVGSLVGCGNPCAAKTKGEDSGTSTEVADPCAATSDPCAATSDPCAATSDPCAAKSDPCAATSDPCAGT